MEMTTQEKVDRLWDIHEISNLMGRYAYLHTARMHMETVKLFALSRDDVWVDCNGVGFYEGPEGIQNFFYDFHMALDGDERAIGQFNVHTQTTPVIEVARDGKTAKGIWISPGLETRISNKTNQLQAYWVWGKYYVDFIKENGEWKLWHFIITAEINCEYEQSWVTYSPTMTEREIPMGGKPSRLKSVLYSKDYQSAMIPELPEPYDTYGGK